MRTVFVVRHGRTALNATGRFRGREDVPLDDVGLTEVAATGERLAGRLTDVSEPPIIHSSPLTRTRQTAEAIAHACGGEPISDERLLDLDHGAWTGLTADEAAARDPEAYRLFREDPEHAVPPGGEPLEVVQRRMRDVLRVSVEGPAGIVVLVSHEIPIRLLCRADPADQASMWRDPLPTGSISTVEPDGSHEGWSVTEPW
jgi:probable phosphoglycerate mutase